jgi:hypothetical protein
MSTYWREVWRRSKEFTTAFSVDLFKAVQTLAGLAIFYVFIRGLGWMGYSAERLEQLEEVHYWLSYGVLVVLGIEFLIRLALSPFKGDE